MCGSFCLSSHHFFFCLVPNFIVLNFIVCAQPRHITRRDVLSDRVLLVLVFPSFTPGGDLAPRFPRVFTADIKNGTATIYMEGPNGG